MKLLALGCVALAAAALQSATAGAQCTKDIECKGNRVCQNGQCVDAPAPVYAPSPAQPRPIGPVSPFQSGYATVALVLDFHGWGTWNEDWQDLNEEVDGDLETEIAAGIRLAGYATISESFHIGGYWTFLKPDAEVDPDDGEKSDLNMFVNMLGLTMKFGSRMAERVWIGGATDIGVMLTKGEIDVFFADDLEMRWMAGLILFPRFNLDVMLINVGAFKLSATFALGIFVSPISGGHPYDADDFDDLMDSMGVDGDSISTRFWWISPAMLIGLSAGS